MTALSGSISLDLQVDHIVDTPTNNPTGEPTTPPPPALTGTHSTTGTAPSVVIPAGVPVPELVRRSRTWPAPTLTNGFPDPDVWKPTAETVQKLGYFQVVIGGVDRTWFRGVPITVGRWAKNQPFGDNTCSLNLPQVTIFERTGVGDLAWLRAGTGVEVYRRSTDGTVSVVRFEGFIPRLEAFERGRDGGLTVTLLGALYEADLTVHRPKFHYDVVDLGARIAEAMSGPVSRHYIAPAAAVTTIPTRKRGTLSSSALGFAQELLALATTADGTNQWTVDKDPGRRAVIRLKDRTTAHWSVTAGAPGVDLSLVEDWTGAANVIFGEGVAPDGCTWRNAKQPNFRADNAPPYPYASASTVINIGTTGEGVRTWQREMANNGYPLAVDGFYGTEDAYQCRRLQQAAGIQGDGIVGPQTWAATFEVGSNVGDLDGAYIAALAYRTQVEPRLFNAQGADIGANPAYDPTAIRVERYINYGDGVSKRDATAHALSEIARFADPGWLGQITLVADPEEGTRFDIEAGQNLRLRHFAGHGAPGLVLHIAGVDGDIESGTVGLTVDSKARDLMAITAVQQRDREALSPGFTGLGHRPSTQSRDVASWDCENGSGIVPRHALFGGLWTVLRIPAGRAGTIARTTFTTTGPASRFAVGVFSKAITANQLAGIVGNPLAAEKSWTSQYDALVPFGWLIAWGDAGQAAGYFPGLSSDADAVTGRLVDDATWNYESDHAPWLWLAEYAPASCFIEGRLQQQIVTF